MKRLFAIFAIFFYTGAMSSMCFDKGIADENADAYQKPLPHNATLCVFNGSTVIFQSCGKWLMPLFELEDFFKTYDGPRNDLRAHDTAVGKAAAVLMVRMGIRKIHANLASVLAQKYIEEINACSGKIIFTCETCVPRLLCATEDMLEIQHDVDAMYMQLRQRAKLVQGVDVRVEQVTAKYGHIKNLSFTVPAGGRLMIAGENGAGKTTLLKLLIGVHIPDSGAIFIDGVHPLQLPKRTIGYIPQATDVVAFSLSVEEVVSLGLERRAKNKAERMQKALMRTGTQHLCTRSFASLSGGEKQKVSLARCLAQNAKLLLLDEPTAALDADNRAMVVEILYSLSVSEIPTIIVATHDDELMRMKNWQHLVLGRAYPCADDGEAHG